MSKISKTDHRQSELYRSRLSSQLNPKQALLVLMHQINWASLEEKWGGYFDETKAGRKAKPARLIAGLLILQHVHRLSDEEVVKRWVENPYFQHFCGYDYLPWEFRINPSSLTR
jgi:IS5 family transposase